MNYTRFKLLDGPRYSPNFRKWYRKNRAKEITWGRFNAFDSGTGLYIGYRFDGQVIGSNLNQIINEGASAQLGSWCGSGIWKVVKDFWKSYEKSGICYTDPNHRHYKSRWENATEDTRRCVYCGLKQRREIRTRTETFFVWS